MRWLDRGKGEDEGTSTSSHHHAQPSLIINVIDNVTCVLPIHISPEIILVLQHTKPDNSLARGNGKYNQLQGTPYQVQYLVVLISLQYKS